MGLIKNSDSLFFLTKNNNWQFLEGVIRIAGRIANSDNYIKFQRVFFLCASYTRLFLCASYTRFSFLRASYKLYVWNGEYFYASSAPVSYK